MPKMSHFSLTACLSALLLWGLTSCQSESTAPPDQWRTALPETQGFDSSALAAVIEQIDEQDLPIDSLLVARNGVLILDAYFYPYLGDQPHDVASVTKSITSTLVGIAVDQGLLTIDQHVMESFPELISVPPSDPKSGIELRHLLTMTSGLDCGRTPGEPELFAMMASNNYVRYALELPMAVAPGTEFAYCSPGSHVLSAMVGKAAGTNALEFAKVNLFGPLGIVGVNWPEDPQGVTHGWGDLQLHPRDMAKVGQLFLNEGSWNGVQRISKEWVAEASRSALVVEADGTGYGYQWWVPGGAFTGVYEARGRAGQAITVWPDKSLVAVFTGRGLDVRGDVAPLLVSALKSDSAIDPDPEAYARLDAAVRSAREPPPAKPVLPLPPIADEVSGKIYRLEPNQFEVRCISLRFDSASEVWFDLTLDSGEFELPVGMDGVPRFSDIGPSGIPIGMVGEWIEPRVFSAQYDEVAGPNHLRIRAVFDESADRVELEFTDPGEYFPPEVVQASAVASCL